jgi:hypothetical protein
MASVSVISLFCSRGTAQSAPQHRQHNQHCGDLYLSAPRRSRAEVSTCSSHRRRNPTPSATNPERPKKTPIGLLPAAGVYNAALLHHAGQDC